MGFSVVRGRAILLFKYLMSIQTIMDEDHNSAGSKEFFSAVLDDGPVFVAAWNFLAQFWLTAGVRS